VHCAHDEDEPPVGSVEAGGVSVEDGGVSELDGGVSLPGGGLSVLAGAGSGRPFGLTVLDVLLPHAVAAASARHVARTEPRMSEVV
jgi:hypothetical protein